MPAEAVNALELEAYVDGELDLPRRLAVEDHLAGHPDLAARVMCDLRLRTALLIGQAELDDRPELTQAAARLGDRLRHPRRRLAHWLDPLRLSGIGALGVAAMLGGSVSDDATPPDFVADAAESYRAGLLRAAMPSQLESVAYDPRDIERRLRLRIPTLNAAWRITDVQVVPSDAGPAVQIMVRTAAGDAFSVFAVRTAAAAPLRPVAVRAGGASVAYWRRDGVGYAVTGTAAPAALDAAAEDLADNHLS